MSPVLMLGLSTDVELRLENEDGTAANIAGATSVKARLVSLNRATNYTPVYECTDGYATASWAAGLVVVPVLGSDTTSQTPGKDVAVWQVNVVLAGKTLTFLDRYKTSLIKTAIP